MFVASSSLYAWILVAITSVASILGCLTIYVDVIWNAISKRHFSILHSDTFLGVALSLSCGTLLVTSLNALLPKSLAYILEAKPSYNNKEAQAIIVPFVAVGAFTCLFLNFIVLRFAANSLAACPHDLDTVTRQRKTIVHGSHEHLPLLQDEVHDHGAVRCETHHSDLEHTGGTTSLNHNHPHLHDTSDSPNSHQNDTHEHVSNEHEDHQHATHSHTPHDHTPLRGNAGSTQLLALSLQTTLGICVHRLPEGLMLFATSRADSELGLSMVLALSVHSFSEGFSVAAPLYGALQNRLQVILFTILLVCGPQILGAYIGSKIFTSDGLPVESMFAFGLCMAGTAGFMLVVCIQMIGSAFRYMSQDAVLVGVLAGVLFSLASRIL